MDEPRTRAAAVYCAFYATQIRLLSNRIVAFEKIMFTTVPIYLWSMQIYNFITMTYINYKVRYLWRVY